MASNAERVARALAYLEHIMENVSREPQVVDLPEFHTIGMARIYDPTEPNDIPVLWGEFAPRVEEIPHVIPGVSYGVCICSERTKLPAADGIPAAETDPAAPPRFEYVAAVGVERVGEVPEGMVVRTVPAARYLVFTHRGHISRIKETIDFIWGTWLPRSEHEPAPTPDFERYDERFNGATGEGELEIFVPVAGGSPES